jgi:hypothetical protein
VLTSEPVARLFRKLSSDVCAELMSPELRAEPMFCSSFARELLSEDVEEVDELLSEELLSVELLENEYPLAERRLVRLS